MGVHMSVARRRAVVAGLVTGGFLVSGLSASSQNPAFANAVASSPSPLPGRGQHEPRPLRHAEPIAVDARAHHERQPGPFHVPSADIHTQPDRLHIVGPHAEHELGSLHVSRPNGQPNVLGIFQPNALGIFQPSALGFFQPERPPRLHRLRRGPAARAPAESE